jgi:ATP-dependent Zn protease
MAGQSLPEPGEITLRGAVLDKCIATLESLKLETKAILREHWSAVKRVAKALFERDRLDQAEIDRLIAG